MPDDSRVRTVSRRGRNVTNSRTCSCALLEELCGTPVVAEILADAGCPSDTLIRTIAGMHADAGPEPADWRLRLQQRGGREEPGGELEQLLAIVRCADTHAYRALEQAGVDGHKIRKYLIDRVRARGSVLTESPPIAASPSSSRHYTRQSQRRIAGTGESQLATSPRLSRRASPVDHGRAENHETTTKPEAAAAPRMESRAERHLEPLEASRLAPLHGRKSELATLADALLRHGPRAPLLVGDQGSGRTLLATHLASLLRQPIYRLEAPNYVDDEQLQADLDAIAEQGGVVVFDDLDRVAGDAPPAFLGSLARAWATGAPRVLTLLSHEGRCRLDAWMPGVLETLNVIVLPPLDPADVHAAVKLAAPCVLEHHGVELAPATHLAELARLADRHLGGLAMPGRAIDLLDLSCARTLRSGQRQVDHERWVEIVSERTGLPPSHVSGTGDQDMIDLDSRLARQVVGHGHALETLAQLIRRNRAGFSSGRPIASVLLLGPSGVGKTEIAKALATALFARDDGLLRLDMSEYAEAHAVARVVGAPPGYVGHEQGGALTDPLLRQPHRVVLLDEIEKAHRDVHQLLLQVFDEGRLTDGRGRTVDFRHSVVIMTSNLGADRLQSTSFGRPAGDSEILATARAAFPIELWNRIEAPLVLRPLEREQMLTICQRLAHRSSERLLRDRGIRYSLSERACEWVVDLAGDDPALGARPLRHLLSREVEGRIAEAVLRGQVRAGQAITVDTRARGLHLTFSD